MKNLKKNKIFIAKTKKVYYTKINSSKYLTKTSIYYFKGGNMKYTSDIAKLCRELFFQTGKIGYYILAKNIEESKSLEETLEL